MYLNLVIVSLLATATARHLPENDGPYFAPPPMDFPMQMPLQRTSESHGMGVMSDQGYGAAIPREKPSFDEFGRPERRSNDDRRPVHHEEPKLDEIERGNIAQDKNFQENSKTFEDFAQGDQRTFDRSQDDRRLVQENLPGNRNVDHFDLGGEDKNKKQNVQHKVKNDTTVTEKLDPLSVVPIKDTRDNFSNTFKETLPKTNLNNNVSKNFPIDNEVTYEPFERRTVESDLNGNVTDDRWIWGETTTTTTVATPTETDLDNRAAFDGGQCPTGQVRIKGSNMCVDQDED